MGRKGWQTTTWWRELFRVKPLEEVLGERGAQGLRRRLGPFDLVFLGVGAIIGTGIFVLTGVAASRFAGPGVIISFVLAGVASALAALVYAELASMVPVAGSAYTYAYAALGELVAWIIGWDLILEYTVAAGAVAIGWSGYLASFLKAWGIPVPAWMAAPPGAGGIVNLLALPVVLFVAAFLTWGNRLSATANNLVVLVKLAAVVAFLAVGLPRLNPSLWFPMFPYGPAGVITGASIVFFAYIGFDAVSTAAEEVTNPRRDLPRGILGSLAISASLYVAVAAVLTGLVSWRELNVPSPLAYALARHGLAWASALISLGAVAGLTSVILVNMFGQTRVFFAMARDGLLPRLFASLHPRFGTPALATWLTATAVFAIAGFLPIALVAELANIGTLAAFVLVSLGVIVLRRVRPEQPRPFRVPGFPWTPLAAMAFSLYLMLNLPLTTWIRFLVWLVLGLTIYGLYGRRASRLAPVWERPILAPQPLAKPLERQEGGPLDHRPASEDEDHPNRRPDRF
ncbi:MAG: amino acid permease [Moorellales bacterium]